MFVQYNVFVKGMKIQDNFENPITTNSYKMSIGWGDENTELSSDIYVQAVYAIGKANSDTVTISNDIIPSAIDAVNAGPDFSYNNGILTVADGATMDVSSINGTVIAVGRKEPLDLTSNPAGVYLVKVTKNGVSSVYKVVAGSKH